MQACASGCVSKLEQLSESLTQVCSIRADGVPLAAAVRVPAKCQRSQYHWPTQLISQLARGFQQGTANALLPEGAGHQPGDIDNA